MLHSVSFGPHVAAWLDLLLRCRAAHAAHPEASGSLEGEVQRLGFAGDGGREAVGICLGGRSMGWRMA